MQKKIYSLFLAPCLVLCLTLGFLMSCGSDDPAPVPQSPPSPSAPVVPGIPDNPDPSVVIDPDQLGVSVSGGKLYVSGRVDLTSSNGTVISKIDITLKNLGTGTTVAIPLNMPGADFGDGYAFIDGQEGYTFNGTNCELSKGPVQVSIRVYISSKPTVVAAGVDLEPYENTPQGCQDRALNVTAEPPECANFSRNPPGPAYKDGDVVTLTANSCATYEFQYWKDGGITESEANPYTFTITGNKNLTAYYLKNYTLVKDDVNSKDYIAGSIIMNAVKFTGTDLVAEGNNNKITEWFQVGGGRVDQIGHDPATAGPLPDNPKTANFTPADGRDEDDIGYTVNYYFLVKTTSGGGWPTWYLMHGTNCGNAPVGTKCTAVTVWKAQ